VVEAHIIDERSEWRTFGDKDKEGDDPSRVGGASNPLLDDGGLGTMIGRVAGDGGNSFALNKMHMRQSNQMRALRSAFGAIGEMCTKLNQSDAVKTGACEIYKNVRPPAGPRGLAFQYKGGFAGARAPELLCAPLAHPRAKRLAGAADAAGRPAPPRRALGSRPADGWKLNPPPETRPNPPRCTTTRCSRAGRAS
jgi:hypothetical protein